MTQRRHDPNLRQKLAALIVLHFGIPRDHAKTMTPASILALVQWDHQPVPHAVARDLGWSPSEYNHPSNLVPLFSEDHSVKTATIDVPAYYKSDRISAAQAEHRRRMLAKAGADDDASSPGMTRQRKMAGRGFPKTQRKMVSRPFPKRQP